ncbi:MAG: 50S ribosomal protein L17 [Rhodothermaceae bacterium]|nr:50S ribosomal protein L17 [Rhodothermaceae bacterium]MXW32679.1 50S ribosomal protein L17 [Rhodothermaceae bacterium]MXX97132.1 50S ribosomal protein L17 [Rhodothermaceae bacterium]MXZ17823.1 50S ribosomal protein L17 [Rhodothermaceae bacterium]MXZ58748.1 50S ribosomal protein L17 [Rhodothermaceae bacterium]
MRHAKKGYKLSRTASHRKATLAALSVALIRHKRITTTLTKAKALRIYVEPLITRARVDTTHHRREVFRHLMDKAAVTELFDEISEKVGDRPGGYTRVLRLGQRQGDAAEMAVIELVDYNDSVAETRSTRRRRTRRGSRRRSSTPRQVEVADAATIPSSVEEEDVLEVEEVAPEVEDVPAEDAAPEVEDVSSEDNAPEVEDVSAEDTAPEAEDVSVEDTAQEAGDASAEDVTPETEDASTEVEDDAKNSAESKSDKSATGGKESTPS